MHENAFIIVIASFRAKACIDNFSDGRTAASGSIVPSPLAH